LIKIIMEGGHQYCTFYLDKTFFGIQVDRVQEIIRFQEMAIVPMSPDIVKGLINLRGQIITGIDLRKCLDFNTEYANKKPMNVIVKSGAEAFSLLVDRIGDVLDLSEDLRENKPDTLSGKVRDLISDVYKLENKLLLVLDIDKIIDL